MYEIAAQLVGFIAMSLCIGCFQCKSRRRLLALQLAGNAVFILHYIMLGAYSGCASLVVLVISNLVLLFHMQGKIWARYTGWKWLFCAVMVLVTALAWRDWFSLLPGMASIAFILTNWTCSGKIMRLGKLFWWSQAGLYTTCMFALALESSAKPLAYVL